MINKLMIEKFKQIENIINDYDIFSIYTFDEFCNDICSFNDLSQFDDDEYIVINFENDIIVHTQNYDIEYVENVDYHNALYDILKTLFCCEYVKH